MSTSRNLRVGVAAAAVGVLAVGTAAPGATAARPAPLGSRLTTVAGGFTAPRGVASLGVGRTVVADSTGKITLVTTQPGKATRKRTLTSLPARLGSVAVDNGRRGTLFLLTGGGAPGQKPPKGGATLYRWRPGQAKPRVVADIAKYQKTDPDPYNLADPPTESNPFGVAALRDGTVLVADAANNDLLRVWPGGRIRTVARLKPRLVTVPPGLPKAGTKVRAEAVATSVTVGRDGAWYVGELRGYPATPGTSEIWRIRPGSVNAVCDPAKPVNRKCSRYSDGLTSIVDLAGSGRGIYAVELSKKSWLAVEQKNPPKSALVGALVLVRPRGQSGPRIRELVKNQLTLPGGVDVNPRGAVLVTSPILPVGPGRLQRTRP